MHTCLARQDLLRCLPMPGFAPCFIKPGGMPAPLPARPQERDRSAAAVLLTTLHKFKGQEAGYVLMADDFLRLSGPLPPDVNDERGARNFAGQGDWGAKGQGAGGTLGGHSF